MKRLIAIAVLLLEISILAGPWADAQDIPMGFDVFAEFGPSCLKGEVHSGASGEVKCEAGRFFTGGRLRLTRHDAIEGSYSYSPDVFNEAFPKLYFNGRLSSHSVNYVRYLSVNPHLQPFVTAGIGAEHFQGAQAATPVSVSQFAWNFGGGIDAILQRHIALRFEIRDYATSIPVYNNSTLHNIVPSFGIVFRFDRNRKP